jgi:hypothetical protein
VAGKAFQRLPRTLASIRYKRLATIFVKDSGQIADARNGNDRAPHSKSTPRVIFITDRGRAMWLDCIEDTKAIAIPEEQGNVW